MKTRHHCLMLCVAGFILPYFYFTSYLLENGMNVPLLIEQLLANDISIFFATDLIISAVLLLVFILTETKHLNLQHLCFQPSQHCWLGFPWTAPVPLHDTVATGQ
ncbi:MAG: DUF2834 domain-containing protein [Methanosarcinaceae archaeon]|nr:DUF2834 domain-containing protein [Methanosarcinaceae archaeon]